MAEKVYKNRVKEKYEKEVVPFLMKKFGYKSVMQCPRLVKIVINTGLGDIKDNAKSIQVTENEIKLISGQKPVLTKAKKSVANFKVREGQTIGIKVTLRGDRMYDFYDKFVSIALPRLRDFRGVSDKAFDGRGNYSVGLKDQHNGYQGTAYLPRNHLRSGGKDPRHGRCDRNHRENGRRGKRAAPRARHAVQEVRREENGKEVNDKQATENAQVFHESVHALHDLRKTSRGFEKVWRLPYLFQKSCV